MMRGSRNTVVHGVRDILRAMIGSEDIIVLSEVRKMSEKPRCFGSLDAITCMKVKCEWFGECTVTVAGELYGLS